jgi:Family of unknown function (DUF6069)
LPAELPPSVDRALEKLPPSAERALQVLRVDFAPEHRQPSTARVLAATAVALTGSLVTDAILAKAAQTMFPATRGYAHFRFSDYAKLTIIGVIIACVAWPIVTRISSEPRWLFFRQAIAVTLVLFLPDLYILYQGQPGDAVAVLMVMHVAIALVTYNALVHIAQVHQGVGTHRHAARGGGRARHRDGWDEDYAHQGYAHQGYAHQGYAHQGYGREDYGLHDYGRQDYGYEDRYPEPARRYPGYDEQDDPYEAYFRPANRYEGRPR